MLWYNIIMYFLTMITYPFSLLHIPSIDYETYFNTLTDYGTPAIAFVRAFVINDVAISVITYVLGSFTLFYIAVTIAWIMSFFRKGNGGEN